MVRRHEFADQAWAEIAPLPPPGGRPGSQWAGQPQTMNGILWKPAAGCPVVGLEALTRRRIFRVEIEVQVRPLEGRTWN
jgi:transposase